MSTVITRYVKRFVALLAASGGSAVVGFIHSAAGAVARTLQSKMREVEISLTDFGADNTGAASVNAALAAAKTYIDTLKVTPNANGPTVLATLVIPPGTYLLTADAALPERVRCNGRFTGAFKLTMTQVKRPHVVGLSCTTLQISGAWFGVFHDIYANLLIDGGGVGFGTFWCDFKRIVGNVAIDLSNWSVNQNEFTGRGGFVTTGAGVNVLDGHSNNTSMWDFTGGQCSNTASVLQDSVLIGSYYEAGADIVGPFHVIGAQGDAAGPPQVGRDNHIFAMGNVAEKNRRDFIAAGVSNILQGGEWDYLDGAGKPVCLASSGGTTIATDDTEPFGIGKTYGGNFTVGFTGFAITVPPCRSGKFALVVAYKGNDFAAVEVARGGGGTTTSGGHSVVPIDAVNGWKLLRLSGDASTTANTTVNLFALTAVGAKTITVGGMFATSAKAAFLPSPKVVKKLETNTIQLVNQYEQWGLVDQAYIAGASVDLAVVYPKAFSAVPRVTCAVEETDAGNSSKFTKFMVMNPTVNGCTIRVFFAVEWAGRVNWHAIGPV